MWFLPVRASRVLDGEPKFDGPWKSYLRLQKMTRFWISTVFVKFRDQLPCQWKKPTIWRCSSYISYQKWITMVNFHLYRIWKKNRVTFHQTPKKKKRQTSAFSTCTFLFQHSNHELLISKISNSSACGQAGDLAPSKVGFTCTRWTIELDSWKFRGSTFLDLLRKTVTIFRTLNLFFLTGEIPGSLNLHHIVTYWHPGSGGWIQGYGVFWFATAYQMVVNHGDFHPIWFLRIRRQITEFLQTNPLIL